MTSDILRREPNRPWSNKRSKRRRTRGPLDPSAYASVPVLLEVRDKRKYCWRDLQGVERIDMLRQVRDCAMAAMTNFEIAQHFGVEERTLTKWMMQDPEFAVAMRLPRELADERVEKSLYARAVGYQFQAEEIKITESGDVHRVTVIKHVPPDIGAGIFWLKNRRPHLWRDKVDVNANVEGKIDVNHADDPRALAMAVLDVIQQAIYDKLPVTVDDAPVDTKRLAEYNDVELEQMDTEELDRLFRGEDET